MVLPAWLAVSEHVPAAKTVTNRVETVQTPAVVDAKLTASPELAVDGMFTPKFCVTLGAAR
jgi:hypothetical protein